MLKNSSIFRYMQLMLLGVFLLPMIYSQSSAEYCSATSDPGNEWITYVGFNEIDNSSDQGEKGYEDFSDISTQVDLGSDYSITVNVSPSGTEYVAVWIDFNQNENFDDDEMYQLSPNKKYTSFNGTISIPSDLKSGYLRMRVRLSNEKSISPCDEMKRGETEDYTVQVGSGSSYCESYSGTKNDWITYVNFNEIDNSSDASDNGYEDFSDVYTKVGAGKDYKITVNVNPNGTEYVSVWTDFNQNFEFEDDEMVTLTTNKKNVTFTGNISIPNDIKPGKLRMRVRLSNGESPYPCGDMKYGETEDYTVIIDETIPEEKFPDATITNLTGPVAPFLMGISPVTATLQSVSEDINLTSARIEWYVNNVYQGVVNWNGLLQPFQTASINFGNYNFTYPKNETVFAPFQIMFRIIEVNNTYPDGNPDNDIFISGITPILNDAGSIGLFGPTGGFGAGVTPVKARIMNYGPKPLSRITVNWKVDGVTQTPKTFTGLNVQQNQTIDLDMGSYTFYNKTPLGPFSVEVWTEKPNNFNDEDTKNDKFTGGIGPSLSAGIYFAGGANAHFNSPSEAFSYINASGVFGTGNVVIEIRPGSYNGQLILNNALANNNQIIVRSSTGNASDVILANSPSSANNFVVRVANINGIRFENLTIQNNNSNSSNAGRVMEMTNVSNFTLDKMVLNGVALSPKNAAYNLLTLFNSKGITITGSDFNRGAIAISNTSALNPAMTLDGNTFTNFSMHGIFNTIAMPGNDNSVKIMNNKFNNSVAVTPYSAIYSQNSTTVSNNIISGINGAGNAFDALIQIVHTSPNPANTALIENNTITNCSNINGIMISNAYTVVNKNLVVISQSGNFNCALIDVSGSQGIIGNNMLMGVNIMGFDIANSPMLNIAYNTVSADYNNNPLVRVTGTGADIKRNIFVNKGSGVALETPSTANIDQNVLSSAGANVLNLNGMLYASMDEAHAGGIMPKTTQVNVEFASPSDPHLKIFNSGLVFDTPLFSNSTNPNGFMIESTDFDGQSRVTYYAGSDEIFLSINIERQSDGFVDCYGTDYNLLTVSSAIGYNAPLTYQWELDRVPIPGATEPVLYFKNLQHKQAGVYRCLVKGPGATVPVYSKEVAVYVTRPTEITEEPDNMSIQVGKKVELKVGAHVNGIDLPTALANQTVRVMWYKFVDGVNDILISDTQMISGSKSNILTFKHFKSSDAGEYYAVVIGLCDRVKTKNIKISEEIIDLTIVNAPQDLNLCIGTQGMFTVLAQTSSSKTINYLWMKDGAPLNNTPGKYMGTTTNTLTVMDAAETDKGYYSVMVTLSGTPLSENPAAMLDILTSPVIMSQPENVSVEIGKPFTLDVTAQTSNPNDILTYTWFKGGVEIQSSTDPAYNVAAATLNDAGEYYVTVANTCSTATSIVITVTVTPNATTGVFETTKNGYSLSTAVPNPVQSNSVINFSVPTESYVKIVLTDASGSGNIVLAEGNYAEGKYILNLDAKAQNLVSGTYFYIMEANGIRLAQKLIVIR